MPIDVACPSCLRSLKVREEYVGGNVRCPVCGAVFVATPPTPATPVSSTPDSGPRPRRRRRRRRLQDPLQARLNVPAALLIILGGSVALIHLALLVMYLVGTDLIPLSPHLNHIDRSWIRGFEACNICFPFMGSAVLIVAGVKMLQREHYQIAVTGSILAMIPCTAGLGFVFGIPIGIWCLKVLRDPEIAAAFKVEGEEEKLAEWPGEDEP